MAMLTMVEAINLALKQEMEKDPRVLILGEDVGQNGGVFRVTQGLLNQLRRAAGHGHAIIGIGHCRSCHRHGGLRSATRSPKSSLRDLPMRQWSSSPIMPAGSEIGRAAVIIVRSSFGFLTAEEFAPPSIIPIATKRISFMYRDSK